MDIRNAINVLRQAQPHMLLPGFTQESVDEAWQALFDFLEQHRERLAELDATDTGEGVTDSNPSTSTSM